tara:strand:+ start:2335 stop:4845 length:2511 start_codon:yes stop_codon:yes gene_type:complete
MLDITTKKRIDDCRDILVGKLPDPKAQIEQITIGLIYKFMDDMDKEAIELGGSAKFFSGGYEKYSWDKLFDTKVTASEMLRLYSDAIESMEKNPNIPQLFRDIFNNAYLPYRDPETLKLFLKTIGEFEYTHSEKLGDAFEYLLSVMGSQGDAGQFRTPRHIIDFLVAIIDPDKGETILDPACGTAGFLISAYRHILLKHTKANKEGLNIYEYNKLEKKPFNNLGDSLTPDDRKKLIQNFAGYDISPDMVRLSLVNLYLHGFSDPYIIEYDTLSSEDRWNENFDVVLANPPFMSPKGGIRPHKKFTISSNRSEVLFVDYIAEHLNPKGKAGIIVPEGVIFQSGTAYKDLRKMLVENYLYAVISLPAGVFNPYSGVKTSILLMDKALAKQSNEILFVKIGNDGYNLGAQRTAVKGSQLEEAITVLNQFKTGGEIQSSIANAVLKNEIGANGDYNLSGERYKLKPLLNSEYSLKPLGELCELRLGGTPSKKESSYWQNGTIKWISNKCIDDFGNIISHSKITNEAMENSSAKIAPKGSTIMVTRVSVGKYAFPDEEVAINQDMTALIPKSKELNPKFLRALAPELGQHIDNAAEGIGVRGVSLKFMRELLIPIPPLPIQEEIVAKIEGYQKIIDGAKVVVSHYRPNIDIDPDWEMVELGEVAKPEYGFTEKAKDEGDARFIRITDIGSDGKLIESGAKYISLTPEAEKSIVRKGDILLARTGATYGKTMIFEADYPAVFASFLIRLNFDLNRVYPKYYWAFAQSESYINQAASLMTGGGQPQFNGNTVVKIKLPLPSIETQRQIVAQIEKEQALVNSNKQLVDIFEKKVKDRIAKVWGE